MPYALFCDDARVSKIYPTQADVWKHARESGLVIDTDTPRHVLDNGYEIRASAPEPGEDPERNEREARAASHDQFVPPQREPERTPG